MFSQLCFDIISFIANCFWLGLTHLTGFHMHIKYNTQLRERMNSRALPVPASGTQGKGPWGGIYSHIPLRLPTHHKLVHDNPPDVEAEGEYPVSPVVWQNFLPQPVVIAGPVLVLGQSQVISYLNLHRSHILINLTFTTKHPPSKKDDPASAWKWPRPSDLA